MLSWEFHKKSGSSSSDTPTFKCEEKVKAEKKEEVERQQWMEQKA